LITLNLGAAGDASAEKAPLINLGAIAPTTATAPLITLDLGSTTEPVAAAAVPAGIRYLCDDGSSLNVAIDTAGATKVATLAMANGDTVSLAEIPSSFGEKYSDGNVTLRVSSGAIQIVQESDRQFCAEQ
jgi:membrane-bound inhibitor of C-type lysozyme